MTLGQGILAHASSSARSARLREFGGDSELSLFLLSRRVENCTKATLASYEDRIRRFLSITGKPVSEIKKADIELYLITLKDSGNSPHYIRTIYRNLGVFFNWLVAEDLLPQSPMRTLKLPKVPKYDKEFLAESDFRKVLSLCPLSDYRGARNACWFWLLWTTGARWSELANLSLSDLNWQASTIRVIGKGNKERQVPFTKDAQRAVYRYLKMRRDSHPDLWITEERTPMKKTGLGRVTRTMFQRGEIKVKDLHHIFRRSWAYRNLKAGVPLKFVQLVGGWDSVVVLEQYVRRMDSEDALGTNVGWQ
jgi:integrase/recombinase XerD